MTNVLNENEEENIHGYTRDMKDFLRKGDFESALILVDGLKKYIKEIKKGKRIR